jgi:hypothetical protein
LHVFPKNGRTTHLKGLHALCIEMGATQGFEFSGEIVFIHMVDMHYVKFVVFQIFVAWLATGGNPLF